MADMRTGGNTFPVGPLPAQLALKVGHVLLALSVVRLLGFHKVVQTAQVVSLGGDTKFKGQRSAMVRG